MSNPYIGEIRPFAGNFAPRNWAFCNGALVSIASNNALFALLGTTYGGNGVTTFGLPDLRGRLAIGQGQGPGLTNYALGQMAGTETVTLTTTQMPAHTHQVYASSAGASGANPSGNVPAAPANNGLFYLAGSASPTTDTPPVATAITNAGGSQPHENMMPYLAISYIIALFGIFPSRN